MCTKLLRSLVIAGNETIQIRNWTPLPPSRWKNKFLPSLRHSQIYDVKQKTSQATHQRLVRLTARNTCPHLQYLVSANRWRCPLTNRRPDKKHLAKTRRTYKRDLQWNMLMQAICPVAVFETTSIVLSIHCFLHCFSHTSLKRFWVESVPKIMK